MFFLARLASRVSRQRTHLYSISWQMAKGKGWKDLEEGAKCTHLPRKVRRRRRRRR